MTPLAEAIERVRALMEKATPGPWSSGFTNSSHAESAFICTSAFKLVFVPNLRPEDALFIVAAINALPALLAAAEEAEKLRADAGAHHGAPIITRGDLDLLHAMLLWIKTVRETARLHGDIRWDHGADWLPGTADILKSRLFWRIRSGKKPLDHPPPTCFSCPWYEVVELPGPHSTFEGGEFKWDGMAKPMLNLGQCPYTIDQRDEGGAVTHVSFGPYKFRVWRGPSVWYAADGPRRGDADDWYIQREEFFDEANTRRTFEQIAARALTGTGEK